MFMAKAILRNFAALAGEIVRFISGAESAIAEVGAQAMTKLASFIVAAKLPKLDHDKWQESALRLELTGACKRQWPNPKVEDEKAGKASGTARQRLTEIKSAVIALTNGVKPLPTENLQAFSNRVKQINADAGRIPALKKREPTGKTKAKAKGKVTMEVTREAALMLLAKGNADVAKVIDFCVTSKMVTLKQMYADATKAANAK